MAPRPLSDLAARLHRAGRLRGIAAVGAPVGPGVRPGGAGLAGAATGGALADVAVHGIAHDSRRVTPGAVFVAVPGAHVDGHAHAADAVARGAAAVVVERPLDGIAVPQLVVDDSQRALAPVACWWYGDPSLELAVVGVTGTDGKTSTSTLLAAALEAAGMHDGDVHDRSRPGRWRRGAEPRPRDDPRGPGGAAAPARDGPGGRPVRGDRDDVARAGARARGRRGIRRGGAHEPHPRAPRVPRVLRGLPGCQAPALRAARDLGREPSEGTRRCDRSRGLAQDRRRQCGRPLGTPLPQGRGGGRGPRRDVR